MGKNAAELWTFIIVLGTIPIAIVLFLLLPNQPVISGIIIGTLVAFIWKGILGFSFGPDTLLEWENPGRKGNIYSIISEHSEKKNKPKLYMEAILSPFFILQ